MQSSVTDYLSGGAMTILHSAATATDENVAMNTCKRSHAMTRNNGRFVALRDPVYQPTWRPQLGPKAHSGPCTQHAVHH